MAILTLMERERNEQAAMLTRVDEAIDAELGREYVRSQRDAYRAIQAEMDAATLEERIDWQIAADQRAIDANRKLLAAKRPALDVDALQEAARRDYGPTARQLATFEVAACLTMALALWGIGI